MITFFSPRSSSEIDPVCRRFLTANFEEPVHGLLVCMMNFHHNFCETLPLWISLRISKSVFRVKAKNVAKDKVPAIHFMSLVHLIHFIFHLLCHHPCQVACGIYAAGFPCQPYLFLRSKSKMLKERASRPLFQVIRNSKEISPAVSWLPNSICLPF